MYGYFLICSNFFTRLLIIIIIILNEFVQFYINFKEVQYSGKVLMGY